MNSAERRKTYKLQWYTRLAFLCELNSIAETKHVSLLSNICFIQHYIMFYCLQNRGALHPGEIYGSIDLMYFHSIHKNLQTKLHLVTELTIRKRNIGSLRVVNIHLWGEIKA